MILPLRGIIIVILGLFFHAEIWACNNSPRLEACAPSQTVTLLGVFDNEPQVNVSKSVSAAGVNSNGRTTYVLVEEQTSLFILASTTTIVSQLSVPTTYTWTLIEDASGYQGSVELGSGGSIAVEFESCGFGADGRGTCVASAPGFSATTRSGSVVPFYTLTAAVSTPSQTQNSAATPNINGVAGWNTFLFAIVIGLSHVL
ncbi:hypothetical protein DFH08DRAFT_1040916 [Mycena albidolilacea]|uniref:Uncharacterized protein n=1 Tax=Mycena albidolilacea TaxID=1033008 RepID=A0AAD6ZAU0_9AGAR|nr:hypothetical protein DFH08DRAFT_1040916 [Mycena albidolilacea]